MPYIRLPLGIRVALEYEVFGKVVVNVYHVTTTDPIVTAKLFDIAYVFTQWWDNNLSAALSSNIALHTVTALDLDVENGEKITYSGFPAIPGKVGVEAVSNNVALVASFATAKTGRSFRGRSYIAGVPEDDVIANKVTTAFAAGIVGVYSALFPLLAVENALLVVASFQEGLAPRAIGVATEVETVAVNTRIDTQRRRLPKV